MSEFIPNKNENDQNDSQIVGMIVRFLDAEMPSLELAEFNAILRQNPRARSLLVRMSTHETRMAELLYGDRPTDIVQDLVDKCEDSQENSVSNVSSSNSHQQSAPLPSEGLPTGIGSILGSHLGMICSGAVLLLFVIGVYQWSHERKQDENTLPIAAIADPPQPEKTLIGTGPLEVRTIKTKSGTTKFTLANTGYVITEGPTDLEMVGPMHAKLHSGRIKVRVTEKMGKGFVVETPDGKVTDLGTEFILGVSTDSKSTLAVTEGKVNLQVAQNDIKLDDVPIEMLEEGDGLNFRKGSQAERVMSIVTGDKMETFQFVNDTLAVPSQVILDVTDNLVKKDTKKFYEIVPNGLKEDVRGFVDRPHEWNGADAKGMPKDLVGADYVKTFGQDSWRKDIEIQVTLARPAKLYLFVDDRQQEWDWLKKDFQKTGDKVGSDAGRWGKRTNVKLGVGPGNSIENTHNVWVRVVTEPGTIKLGPPHLTGIKQTSQGMYGIAAVPLTDDERN